MPESRAASPQTAVEKTGGEQAKSRRKAGGKQDEKQVGKRVSAGLTDEPRRECRHDNVKVLGVHMTVRAES